MSSFEGRYIYVIFTWLIIQQSLNSSGIISFSFDGHFAKLFFSSFDAVGWESGSIKAALQEDAFQK